MQSASTLTLPHMDIELTN